MAKQVVPRKVAKYLMVYWDKDWNEIASPNHLHTAGEMFNCLERWNSAHQRATEHHQGGEVCDSIPAFVTLEVRYVER